MPLSISLSELKDLKLLRFNFPLAFTIVQAQTFLLKLNANKLGILYAIGIQPTGVTQQATVTGFRVDGNDMLNPSAEPAFATFGLFDKNAREFLTSPTQSFDLDLIVREKIEIDVTSSVAGGTIILSAWTLTHNDDKNLFMHHATP